MISETSMQAQFLIPIALQLHLVFYLAPYLFCSSILRQFYFGTREPELEKEFFWRKGFRFGREPVFRVKKY